MGEVRAITIDKKTFQKRVVEDPWFAFRVLEKMSRRIRELDRELVELRRVARRPTGARKTKPSKP
jgi:CRP-like cAMP-binding protein